MSDNILVRAGVPLFGLVVYVTYSRTRTSGIKTTPLHGPPRYASCIRLRMRGKVAHSHPCPCSDNWFLGQTRGVYGAKDAKYVTEEWLEKYGGVFRRPGPFWSSDLCVLDPKAVAHVLGHSEVCRYVSRFFAMCPILRTCTDFNCHHSRKSITFSLSPNLPPAILFVKPF
jgi:hypothetical protein